VQKIGGWALSTPVCVLESQRFRDTLTLSEPPLPTMNRTVSLWARKHELADLPQQLATFSRTILQQNWLPDAVSRMPWIEPHCAVLGDAT